MIDKTFACLCFNNRYRLVVCGGLSLALKRKKPLLLHSGTASRFNDSISFWRMWGEAHCNTLFVIPSPCFHVPDLVVFFAEKSLRPIISITEKSTRGEMMQLSSFILAPFITAWLRIQRIISIQRKFVPIVISHRKIGLIFISISSTFRTFFYNHFCTISENDGKDFHFKFTSFTVSNFIPWHKKNLPPLWASTKEKGNKIVSCLLA